VRLNQIGLEGGLGNLADSHRSTGTLQNRDCSVEVGHRCVYSPQYAAAFSFQMVAGRMYLRMVRSERQPPCRMIERSGATPSEDDVARPERRECPA
jgi:hypothetical protein